MWNELKRATPRGRCRPGLECLEGRSVPATFAVTTALDVVAADGRLSLREAVSAANARPGPDTVVLPAGVFRIALAGADDANAAGDFDVTGPLALVGRGAAATRIDAARIDRVFDVVGQFGVQFANLTVQNGRAAGNGAGIRAGDANVTLTNCVVLNNRAAGDGGGVWAGQGTVALNRSAVSGNRGANGGGLFALGGAVTATDSRLAGNAALTNGGGVNAESGNVTLVRCVVERNRAARVGGGLRAPAGTLTLRESVVRLNVAGQPGVIVVGQPRPPALGGGVFGKVVSLVNSAVGRNLAFDEGGGVHADAVTLTNSAVGGNQAASGGGVFARSAVAVNSTLGGNSAVLGDGGGLHATTATLTNCAVSGNTGFRGAGVFAATAGLINSTVSGNAAREEGGGLHAATANLTNCTVSGNSALRGGGLFAGGGALLNCTVAENLAMTTGGGVASPGGASRVRVKNAIVADNLVLTAAEVGRDASGDFASDGHNIVGAVDGATGFGAVGDQLGAVEAPLDPRLAPLALNGGRTPTHALLPGSPAIDRGASAGTPLADQRGVARGKDGDGNGSGGVDVGAFER